MKRISILFSLCLSIWSFAQIQWISIEDLIEVQELKPKKILINFYEKNCDVCDKVDKLTYTHPIIATLIKENYYAVKFNIEDKSQFSAFGRNFNNKGDLQSLKSYHEFAKYLNVVAAPTVVFLDEDLSLITKLQGYFSPKEMEPFLYSIATNQYRKINSKEQWLQYQRKFKTKIKDEYK